LFSLKNKQKQQRSSQDLIPIKMIDGGMFVTPDNRLIQILKVSSINTQLMSKNELQRLLESYESFLKSISFPFQIEIVSMPVDLKHYIGQMGDMFQKTKDFNRRALLKSYIDYCQDMQSSRQIMMRQRFIIFDEKIKGSTDKEYEDAVHDIEQKTENMVTGFKDIKLTCQPINNAELMKLFQVFFNYEASLHDDLEPLLLQKITIGTHLIENMNILKLHPKEVIK
jgi:hypothetical protein